MDHIFNKTITIYCSYYPKTTLKRMEKVRDCLIKRKFKNTKLVKDYRGRFFPSLSKDPEVRIIQRSRHCLKVSDLNLIIFTFVGIDSGITTEFHYSIQKKFNFLLYCEEDEEGNIAGSSLIRGRLKELSKSFIRFSKEDDEELCDLAYHRILDFFM